MIDLPFVIIPILAWLVAQILKFAISALRGYINFKLLYQSGGMPSAHTALIVSITTTVAVIEGVSSPLFGVILVLAMIIIYDALGVRRSSGLQAVAIQNIYKNEEIDDSRLALGDAKGHSPHEVLAGGLLGLLIALALTYQLSSPYLAALTQFPTELDFAILVILMIAQSIYSLTGRRSSNKVIRLAAKLLVLALFIVILSTFLKIPILGYRLSFVVILVASLTLITVVKRTRKLTPVVSVTVKLKPKRRKKRK